MVKSISLDQTSLSFPNTRVDAESTAQNVVLTNDGTELLTLSGITFGTDFEGKKSADPTYSSSIAGFTLAAGNQKSTYVDNGSSSSAGNCVVDSNGDLIIFGNSTGTATFNGESVAYPTKEFVWIIKYNAGPTGWSEDWIRVISENFNISTYTHCLTVDDNDDIYVSYGLKGAGFYTTTYVSKIASDNSSINSITAISTGSSVGSAIPLIFHKDYLFLGYYDSADADKGKIKRYNTSLTLQETYEYKYDGRIDPFCISADDNYLYVSGRQLNTGLTATTWFKTVLYLDGSDNITESYHKNGDYAANLYTQNISKDVMTVDYSSSNNEPYLFYDPNGLGVWSNDDTTYQTTYADFNGTSSQLYMPSTPAFSFYDNEDFEFEIEFKLDTTASNAGLWGMNDGTHYTGLYFETLNKRIIFTDTKNSISLSSQNNTVTSTATVYKVKVTRVSNVGTIYIDTGGGYVDQTNVSTGFNNALTKFNASFTLGYLNGPSPYWLNGRIYSYYHYVGETISDNKVIDFQLTTNNQRNMFDNTAMGYVLKITPDSSTFFRWEDIMQSDTHIYLVGRITGVWETANPGDTGHYDYTLAKYLKEDGSNVWKVEYNCDVSNQHNAILSGCYDEVNDLLYASGYSNADIFGSSLGGTTTRPHFFGFRSDDGSVAYTLGTTETINVRFAPSTGGSKSESMTVSSDATSSPDTVALSGLAVENYRFIDHIDDHGTEAKERIINQYR